MSAFFRARQEAHVLRTQLLGKAATDGVNSRELLASVDSVLNIGVKPVAKTNAVLKGGKATLRRKARFIYYRQDFTWSEQAYLIAHELGHLCLDEVSDETINHVNSAGITPTSHATSFVESYGARERDELQKNTFGRELLLPRAVARDLFLSGLGPKAIAKQLEIPLEVARQQVLDAVLLPKYVPPPPRDLPAPSPDQILAINASEKHVNVVAGPGTGKTTTLIHRVKKLIEIDGVPPKKILVLTFTNKAAAELVERLQRTGVKGASEIWAGTFHAFGLEFLRKYYQHFDLPQEVTVADKLTTLTLTAHALASVKLNHYRRTDDPYEWLPAVIEVAQRLKEELVTVDHYLKEALKTCSEPSEEQIFRDVATVAGAYSKVLSEARMIDFVDLVSAPAKAIASDRVKFADIADHYQHVLVDEFQDMTTAMIALVQGLSLNAKSLWVVGDIRQAIYHWRGASLDALLGFAGRFEEAKRYDLVMNRRSSQEIIDLTKHVGQEHPLQAHLPLPAVTCDLGSSGDIPAIARSDKRPAMWSGLISEIAGLAASGIALKDQTVLARKGGCVSAAAMALQQAGIPTLYVGNLTERTEIKDILAVVQLIVEREPRALLRVGMLATPPMTLKDVQAVYAAIWLDQGQQRLRWLGQPITGISPRGELSRADLHKHLKKFSWSTSPWEFVCDLILEQRFLLPDLNDQSIDGHLRRLAVWQFAYMSRISDGTRKRWTLHRFLNRLRLRQQIGDIYIDRELPPETSALEGVRVMTIHASKGLEFEAVHLCGVHGSDFAGGNSPAPLLPPTSINSSAGRYDMESDVECHNLLYVAVSRAKKKLRIYENSDEFPYPFQQVVSLSKAVQHSALISRTLAAIPPVQAPIPLPSLGSPAIQTIAYDEFSSYDKCPRQYLYRHVMQLGRELAPNPALQARSTVMRTLAKLAQAKSFANTPTVFYEEWTKARLPEPAADAQLWAQAWMACEAGAAHLASIDGEYLIAHASINGVEVELPWGVISDAPGGSKLHSVGFYPSSQRSLDRLGKILGQMMHCTTTSEFPITEMQQFDLSRHTIREISTIYVAQRSLLATRTKGMINRQYDPDLSGYPCKRCAYAYVCPTLMAP